VAIPLPQFAELVRQYCAWCEGSPRTGREEAQTGFDLLVQLLAGMPATQGGCYGGAGRSIPDDEWQVIHARFASIPFQYYQSWFDPLNIDDLKGDHELGDIADDLADIWRDLKPGLELYDGNQQGAAAAEWQFAFEAHWGRHATAALYSLHCWLVDHRPK
jgi:hypothetical protein